MRLFHEAVVGIKRSVVPSDVGGRRGTFIQGCSMAILAISKLGNPILRQKALPVSPGDIKKAAFQQLIDDMFETMYDEPGIGLAAPQVGRSQQLVVMDCSGRRRVSQDRAHQPDDPLLRAGTGRRAGRDV